MGMIPYDVRSTVSRYSSCSEHSTTIHAFRSATNKGVSSRPMNDIRGYTSNKPRWHTSQKTRSSRKIQLRRILLDLVLLADRTNAEPKSYLSIRYYPLDSVLYCLQRKIRTHLDLLFGYVWKLFMGINISVQQYNGGFLPDIILLTQGYYQWGTRLNIM